MIEPWTLTVASALEEHHVSAFSKSVQARDRFAADLTALLTTLEGTHVCPLRGSAIVDLPSFCAELEQATGVGPIAPGLGGTFGVEWALRQRPDDAPEIAALKRRFFIWHDAHVLLKRDPALFGRLMDSMTGVAAQEEYVNDDLLLLQRVILVGTPAIDVYAEDPRGQLVSWFREGDEDPLWRIVTGQDGPRVVRWRIGDDIVS